MTVRRTTLSIADAKTTDQHVGISYAVRLLSRSEAAVLLAVT